MASISIYNCFVFLHLSLLTACFFVILCNYDVVEFHVYVCLCVCVSSTGTNAKESIHRNLLLSVFQLM